MVKLNKIYTRTGDDGTTGLVSGPRRYKDDLRVEAFGSVDEINAFVGVARVHSSGMPRVDWALSRIQNDLFDLGADLANPPSTAGEGRHLRITETQVKWLETQIDHFNEHLEPLTSFILPGGSVLSADLHVARVAVRRAERLVVGLMRAEPETGKPALTYLNRLSDLLFVLARVANRNGTADVLWKPGAHTGETPPA
ncbi:MAG: cob(I)yrinic acid a,c-diamide adenosyltransferase [Alphaproteobacteria bacterium]|nr:cob(I)yrinic acid a,c-diamide adenosyltransferase [Alphaproteobacteria bacterium]